MNYYKTHRAMYYAWADMIQRCRNKNKWSYKYYGKRGITVCNEWLKFEMFLNDMGEKPDGTEIDRIDNNLGYYKDNCRWVTHKINSRNKSNNKLNDLKVSIIKELLNSGNYTHKFLANIFGVNRSMVSYIKSGKYWDDVK